MKAAYTMGDTRTLVSPTMPGTEPGTAPLAFDTGIDTGKASKMPLLYAANDNSKGDMNMVDKVLKDVAQHIAIRPQYDNFIGGKWVAPVRGQYFDNISPVNGQIVCKIARSTAEDIELALDAAHKARDAWGRTSAAERSLMLLRIADRMQDKLDLLAMVETIDNGKPIRETTLADLPLAIDHFRYFAGCIRAQEGGISEIDHDTVAYHFHEPLGVVGQIIPWNFPLLMAVWKLAPAIAAGNCVVLKPAEQTAHEHYGADGRAGRHHS